jgi:hypothetical protein
VRAKEEYQTKCCMPRSLIIVMIKTIKEKFDKMERPRMNIGVNIGWAMKKRRVESYFS